MSNEMMAAFVNVWKCTACIRGFRRGLETEPSGLSWREMVRLSMLFGGQLPAYFAFHALRSSISLCPTFTATSQ